MEGFIPGSSDDINMRAIQTFEEHAEEYDRWFDANRFTFLSEVKALEGHVPRSGRGLEVGVGTGRFAVPLGIRIGVEPARTMADMARKRGVEVCNALAEKLPFGDNTFDFLVMVTTICYFRDPILALREAHRVLKPGGAIVIGMLDRDSPLGRAYPAKRRESTFYRWARFYSVDQILRMLRGLRFSRAKISQTIFKNLVEISAMEPVRDGHGEGLFAVISARRRG
jgi:ubiquinone/menaquinone biosynthesis C-methylase UbiE